MGQKLSHIRTWFAELRGWRAWLAALVLGLGSAAAFPPIYAIVLLVPSLTGLMWMIAGTARPREALVIGWWFGVGHFAGGLYWITYAFMVHAGAYGWMAPIAMLALVCGFAAFPAVTAWAARMRIRTDTGRALMFSAVWILFEWVRSWIFTGFPWNLMGSVWAFWDGAIQPTAFIGTYGLGLLTMVAATVPSLFGGAAPIKRAVLPVGLVYGVLGLCIGLGCMRVATTEVAYVDGVSLRLVQPNIPQALKWRRELRNLHLQKQIAMSLRPGVEGAKPPTHVIWPETSVPFYLAEGNAQAIQEALAVAAPKGGVLMAGIPRAEVEDGKLKAIWNSLIAVDSNGNLAGQYDKVHLVPFGEYVPLRNMIPFPKLTQGRLDFSPGSGHATLSLPGMPPVGVLICYEIIFPANVVSRQNRPAWLLNITNDAWFGYSTGPYQHLVAARLRAVEEGLPIIRVANTGISASIDPLGRTVQQTPLLAEEIIDTLLPQPLADLTFYGQFNNTIVFLLLGVVFTVVFALERRCNRQNRQDLS